jgi:uncharacterized ferredoxin-like protein
MTQPDGAGLPITSPDAPGPIGFAELRGPVVRQVGQLMAAAAMTAPKSGGQLLAAGSPAFLETVLVEDPDTLTRLAEWMRARGAERREAIWFRDADAAQALDGVLFIGLVNPYPPNYDCGACAYATCAEFLHATKQQRADAAELEFTGPTCTLRGVDLGVAVGSAARTAALHCLDARCQTRIAVAARKLGLIQADLAVALSLSLTHKAITFDRPMPDIDYDTLNLPSTGTLPIGVPGASRAGGARNKQQPRHPTPRRTRHPPPTTSP